MGQFNRNIPSTRRVPLEEPARRSVALRKGQVVTTHNRIVVVEDDRGHLAKCSLRRKLGRVVCGDYVEWRTTTRGQGIVESVTRDCKLLERYDARGQHRPLAANGDQIVITSAPHPPLNESLIDSYLVAAELIGSDAVILVNKSDLLNQEQQAAITTRLQDYVRIGYPVLFCNTRSAHGTDALIESLKGRTSILVGQSGAGKSSLIRALLPDQQIRIGQLSSTTGLGRHTTTNTTLYHLSPDSHLIDSPGVRDFALPHVAPNQVADGFREFQPYLGKCRFSNCSHIQEPGCAVHTAAANGQINERRLKSYQKMVNQLKKQR